jgi:putative peptidoglycan lipid II flippase
MEMNELKDTLSFALRLVFFFTIPAMVGLIVLRVPIISVLFQRGEFEYQTTLLTAKALLYYSLGLWAVAGGRIIVPTFYSLQDTKTPVKIAMLALFVNIVLSLILAFPLGLEHGGLALATSVSSAINMVVLLIILSNRLDGIGLKDILLSVLKVSISSAVMGVVVYLFCLRIKWDMVSDIKERIFTLGGGVVIGVSIFFLCSFLLKSQESYSFIEVIKNRIRRSKV